MSRQFACECGEILHSTPRDVDMALICPRCKRQVTQPIPEVCHITERDLVECDVEGKSTEKFKNTPSEMVCTVENEAERTYVLFIEPVVEVDHKPWAKGRGRKKKRRSSLSRTQLQSFGRATSRYIFTTEHGIWIPIACLISLGFLVAGAYGTFIGFPDKSDTVVEVTPRNANEFAKKAAHIGASYRVRITGFAPTLNVVEYREKGVFEQVAGAKGTLIPSTEAPLVPIDDIWAPSKVVLVYHTHMERSKLTDETVFVGRTRFPIEGEVAGILRKCYPTTDFNEACMVMPESTPASPASYLAMFCISGLVFVTIAPFTILAICYYPSRKQI